MSASHKVNTAFDITFCFSCFPNGTVYAQVPYDETKTQQSRYIKLEKTFLYS